MHGQSGQLTEFEATYRRHVDMVVAGDLKGVMADMLPSCLPDVFAGVTVPRGDVSAAEVIAARLEGDRGVGEAVYTTTDAVIGLRSGWVHDGEGWKADRLENIETA